MNTRGSLVWHRATVGSREEPVLGASEGRYE